MKDENQSNTKWKKEEGNEGPESRSAIEGKLALVWQVSDIILLLQFLTVKKNLEQKDSSTLSRL